MLEGGRLAVNWSVVLIFAFLLVNRLVSHLRQKVIRLPRMSPSITGGDDQRNVMGERSHGRKSCVTMMEKYGGKKIGSHERKSRNGMESRVTIGVRARVAASVSVKRPNVELSEIVKA